MVGAVSDGVERGRQCEAAGPVGEELPVSVNYVKVYWADTPDKKSQLIQCTLGWMDGSYFYLLSSVRAAGLLPDK